MHNDNFKFVGLQAALFIGFALAYFFIRGLTEGSTAEALANAEQIIEFEQRVGLYWEEDLQSLIVDRQPLVDVVNWIYIWLHWPLIAPAAVYLAARHREGYVLIRNAVFVSGIIGLFVFAIYPVMPPRLAVDALADTVTQHSNAYRVLQPPGLTNQYAAMPSLHFGWNMLIGIGLAWFAGPRWLRALGAVVPFLMFWAVILTANHFVVDPIAGGLLALFGLAVAVALRRTIRVRSPSVTA